MITDISARTSANLAAYRAREEWITLRNLRRIVAAGGELARHDAARLASYERASASALRVAFRMAIGG
jgi:hypothetical protein